MFGRTKCKEVPILVELEEQLTSDSCAKIITELMKYVLYQKQQIPFSCDSLVQLQTRFKPNDRNYGFTRNLFSALESISGELTEQLHLGGCDVKEVVIVIGATTISPKFLVRVEIPGNILSSRRHMEYQHSYRKPLLTLMRTVIECQEFQEAMTVPLGPTNTFVLLQKSDSNPKSDFFLPKPHYSPNSQTSSFCIRLHHKEIVEDCQCSSVVRPYYDNPKDRPEEIAEEKQEIVAPYLWYQSREVVKGFKYQR
ncbi:MAD2L1-binding protein [Diachasma alloeum]|uniref:MAD2L1-binding protein n=1 Tax=Diachasma alloeum TaxID=454923 RepID=UPI000738356A|nr:MAD2L1-binding protein [Diachasma alloeum]XP_015117634.1 MAD2L1-binding protein [Diachasma alloeum]XP_015117635.1 MAD2L1-binding protein [Diachasma alloeum]XP_015117636.1 MAD2L1-binding protein [Diachasma alloeum]